MEGAALSSKGVAAGYAMMNRTKLRANSRVKVKTKSRIKKGDYVQVISGEEAGKRGKIMRVIHDKNLVLVQGVNYVYRHMKKSRKHLQGGRIQREAPIPISNVMLYCHHCQSLTGACYRYEQEEGEDKDKTKETTKPKKVRCCTCPKHMKI